VFEHDVLKSVPISGTGKEPWTCSIRSRTLTIGASGLDEIPTWFLPNTMQNATDTLTYSVTQLLSPLPASNILPEAVQIMIDSKVN
jgi:hypothetical protein